MRIQKLGSDEVVKMRCFSDQTRGFLVDEYGPTATEYAVMLALIGLACIAAIFALGTKVRGVFAGIGETLPVN